jgi:hypothetical protein
LPQVYARSFGEGFIRLAEKKLPGFAAYVLNTRASPVSDNQVGAAVLIHVDWTGEDSIRRARELGLAEREIAAIEKRVEVLPVAYR